MLNQRQTEILEAMVNRIIPADQDPGGWDGGVGDYLFRQFEGDLKSGTYGPVVEADFREAQQRGVSGTPTFVINGTVIAGLQPLEVFERTIERAESEVGGG